MKAIPSRVRRQFEASRRQSVVLHVALHDLLHEFLLTLCLVLSVTAILTPILLLASVKVGFIDRLRQEFIEDPSFREIRPATADLRSAATFADIKNWPGVAYAIPTVMMNPREVAVRVRNSDGIYRGELRLLPSSEDDPFLVRLEGSAPEGDSVAITADFAEAAGIGIGDEFSIIVTRIENDERQRVQINAVVGGVIPEDVLPSPTILATSELEQHVEFYRSGVSVPERGWVGIKMDPRQSYAFMVAVSPEPLGETLRSSLAIRIGARETRQINLAELANLVGVPDALQPEFPLGELLMLTSSSTSYTGRDIIEANDVLRNSEAFAVGAHPDRKITVIGQDIRLAGLPDAFRLGDSRQISDEVESRGNSFSQNDRILLPESLRDEFVGKPEYIDVEVRFADGASTELLVVPLRPAGFVPGDTAIVNGTLMALLDRGRQVSLRYDRSNNSIIEQSAGFRGFRIIGSEIDVIPSLVERLEATGIEVRAKSSQILKLQRLERSLNILVLVVAFVALIGGFSILTSSFFANVQRKKVSYATMRLIGMSKRLIFGIPIAQAAIIANFGFVLSITFYLLISFILNRFIASELNFDGQLSKLYLSHFISAGTFVIAGACAASLAASRAATNIDPADALRAE